MLILFILFLSITLPHSVAAYTQDQFNTSTSTQTISFGELPIEWNFTSTDQTGVMGNNTAGAPASTTWAICMRNNYTGMKLYKSYFRLRKLGTPIGDVYFTVRESNGSWIDWPTSNFSVVYNQTFGPATDLTAAFSWEGVTFNPSLNMDFGVQDIHQICVEHSADTADPYADGVQYQMYIAGGDGRGGWVQNERVQGSVHDWFGNNHDVYTYRFVFADAPGDPVLVYIPLPRRLNISTAVMTMTGSNIDNYIPSNITIDTALNGELDFTNDTIFNESEIADLNVTAINNYLWYECTEEWSGICNVPLNITAGDLGNLTLSDLNVTGEFIDTVGDCSHELYEDAVYFWFAEEASLVGVNGSAEYVIMDTDSYSIYNTSVSNVQNITICTFSNNTYTVNMTLIYWNESSDQRSYYLFHGEIGSTDIENITLYQIPTAGSEKVEITVRDANDNTVADAYVNVQRYYVDEDIYRTITIGKTDGTGKFITYLYTDTVYYKFTISLAGVVSNTYSAMTITDTADDPETLTLYTSEGVTQFFDIRENVGGSCYTNYTTNYTVCTVADATGLITSARLIVEHSELAGPETLCDTSGTGSAFTLTCFLGADANGTYSYQLFGIPSPNPPYLLYSDYAYFSEMNIFGDVGLFPAFMLVLATATIAIFNPPVGAILAVIGLGAGVALNVIEISGAALISLMAVAVIIFMKGRSV